MRAQAALEFIVTYAWAIALVTVTLSWIAYMGFTNPTDFAGDDCRVSGEFGCEEAKLSTSSAASEASFVLRNLQKEKVSVQEVILEYDSQEFTCTRFQNLDGSDLTFVRSGEEFEVLCEDNTLQLPEGENAKVSFTIKYNKSAGFPREATGEITGLVDDSQTPIAFCGDDVVNDGEQCDDGADGDNLDGCTDACEYTQCSAIVGKSGGCTSNVDKGENSQVAGHNSCATKTWPYCVSCEADYEWNSSLRDCVLIEEDLVCGIDAGDGCTDEVGVGEYSVDASCAQKGVTCVSCGPGYSWNPYARNCEPVISSCADAGGEGCTASIEKSEIRHSKGDAYCSWITPYCVSCASGYYWNEDKNNCEQLSDGDCIDTCNPKDYPYCSKNDLMLCDDKQ